MKKGHPNYLIGLLRMEGEEEGYVESSFDFRNVTDCNYSGAPNEKNSALR